MLRLLWLGPERVEPEDSFPPLTGSRPAPEPMSFDEATVEVIGRRLVDVVMVDGRDDPSAASAVIRKMHRDIDPPMMVVLEPQALTTFDWQCGAAEFVTSTCTRDELQMRLARIVEPVADGSADVIRRGNITINRERFEVRVGGQILDLTFKEFELIAHLASRPGKVCSRNALLSEVWGYDFFGGTRTVDVHIRRLRAKLGQESHVIETVRNVGYRFSG